MKRNNGLYLLVMILAAACHQRPQHAVEATETLEITGLGVHLPIDIDTSTLFGLQESIAFAEKT